MQRAMRVFLADQLAGLLASSCPTGQPREPTPHATVGQRGASFRQRMGLPVVINQGPPLGANRLPVGLFGPQKVLRFVQQGLADELFVAQSERVGSL